MSHSITEAAKATRDEFEKAIEAAAESLHDAPSWWSIDGGDGFFMPRSLGNRVIDVLLDRLIKAHALELERVYETGWAHACGAAQQVCQKRAETLGTITLQCEATKCGDAIWSFLMEDGEVVEPSIS